MYIKMLKHLAAKQYQENKKRLQRKAREISQSSQSLSKEEKGKNQQYRREHYKNLSEDEKQKLVQY